MGSQLIINNKNLLMKGEDSSPFVHLKQNILCIQTIIFYSKKL